MIEPKIKEEKKTNQVFKTEHFYSAKSMEIINTEGKPPKTSKILGDDSYLVKDQKHYVFPH